jgi:hypothetical protein
MLDGEYLQQCESCHSEVPLAEFNAPFIPKAPQEKQLLCEVCSTSYISNLTQQGGSYPDKDVLRSVAQAANFTVKKLGGFKGVKSNCPECGGVEATTKTFTIEELDMIANAPIEQLAGLGEYRKCTTCKGVNL